MEHALRKYRKTAHVTLNELGLRVGVSKGFLSKIEKGHQMPSLKVAQKIIDATDGFVRIDDFLKPSQDRDQ